MEIQSNGIVIKVNACKNNAMEAKEILTIDALRFIGFLCCKFEDRRQGLLLDRKVQATLYDAGNVPQFLPPKNSNKKWKCAAIPMEVQDRRVEITGPVDRKMIINGLNSGANVYMADFEDSTSPTWSNIIAGHYNLRDAVRGTISYTHPYTAKVYKLSPQKKTVLFVRPRGWHLPESHVTINGRVASAALIDFGLYFYHNVHALLQNGSKAYFYIPKLETHGEAKLWNDVFIASQLYMGLPVVTDDEPQSLYTTGGNAIRVTVLLETITAAFQMEEILHALRNFSLGLNCGRWDYLFSYIKKFKYHSNKIMPDRKYLTMDIPMMKAYVTRLIHICHKHDTFAMGGMSASIPIKDNVKANEVIIQNIERDKLREVLAGHDGTWVAHPALVSVAKRIFDQHMQTPNQIKEKRRQQGYNTNEEEKCIVTEVDLVEFPVISVASVTSEGLMRGIAIVLAYTEAWLRGIGCIPLNNHMEDAATAEISRVQIWQWRYHSVVTEDDGEEITKQRIGSLVWEEVNRKCNNNASGTYNNDKNRERCGKWRLAGKLVEDMLTKDKMDDFLTTVCYPHILESDRDVNDITLRCNL